MAAPFHFQAFTVKGNGRLNRITTNIQIAAAYDPAAPPNPLPNASTAKALWDTGATNTCITPALAKSMGLTQVGVATMDHGGGKSDQLPRYLVNLTLPNQVVVAGQLITELPAAQEFDVIIGMDIITHGDFSISNVGGKTWLSFRIPSRDAIDYVLKPTSFNSEVSARMLPALAVAAGNSRSAIGPSFKWCAHLAE